MRQRDISKYRIMQAFKKRVGLNLTSREICRITGLTRRTVSPCLGELVSSKALQVSIARDGKTKIYESRELGEYAAPLTIYGSRQRRQVGRLRRLGLGPIFWVRYPRGRPRSPPDVKEDIEILEALMSIPWTAIRHVVKSTGISRWLPEDNEEVLAFSYSGKDLQTDEIRRAIRAARKHFEMLQRMKGPKRPGRTPGESESSPEAA